ncbi:MAG: 1-acyl-sn-glycerol-3-phosphate acyltransferase [Bacteroidetes bacterium]|nr:1-acyl-sn-glycerol-3-phosphate acyltransferase [Bacteroidota bacterium]
MLYRLLKIASRLAIRIYCRKVIINHPAHLRSKGPILLACNHPNSFLDSVIIDTLFDQPVWSLARGDAFKKPFIARLLKKLYILPVYRTSEGVENLSSNYQTFEDCIRLFRQKGIVTIFSEGKCINEWHLRPLKKGTARLAIKAWEEKIPLTVLPVAINYSSFTRFGKNVFIHFGEPIRVTDIDLQSPDGARNIAFNKILQRELEKGVMEIDKKDLLTQKQKLSIPIARWKKILLFIPAIIGWLLHAPLYLTIKSLIWKRTRDNDHYDSVMVGLLLVLYPIYLLLTATAIGILAGPIYTAAIPAMPILAWSYVQVTPAVKA